MFTVNFSLGNLTRDTRVKQPHSFKKKK
uniref:Uncharacterized protein n=1 Tax=Anguilla anguilla TaxID=7936 RepID=A0A0E9UI13_ANGAN